MLKTTHWCRFRVQRDKVRIQSLNEESLMFLDHANPNTGFRFEEREKCEVLYPGSGLLHDHMGRFVLVLKKGKNLKSCTLVPVFSMIMSGGLFS
jgi:hypothetical protein